MVNGKKDKNLYKMYFTSNSVGIKQCCNAKKKAGTKIAKCLFLIWFTPHPRYRPSSANTVETGSQITLVMAKYIGIGAIIIGAVYGIMP